MKKCTKCQRRLLDSQFRTRTVISSSPDIEGRTHQESHSISAGGVCLSCDHRRLRRLRGTETARDVVQSILAGLRSD